MNETSTRVRLLVGTALAAVLMLALSGAARAAPAPFAVTKTVPDGGATGIASASNVKAYFNHDVRASTVTSSTFRIRRQGATAFLGAARSVNNAISPTSANGGSRGVATLNPNADLAPGTTYEVVVAGGTRGVRDVNGMALGPNKSWMFTTAGSVGTPPDTALDSGPQGTVASDSATFTFSASKASSTFECSLDGSAFAACLSPKTYSGLSQGRHTFAVRAVDGTGNPDETPSTRDWTVDTVGPDATITDGPPDPSNSRSVSFAFTGAEPGGGYRCGIGGPGLQVTFLACTPGQSFTVRTDGTFTFSVQASDDLGNSGRSASRAWTVDTAAPIIDAVSPTDGATAVPTGTNVTATFSEAMDPDSVSDQTFALSRPSSPDAVGAVVRYDPAARMATLDPVTNLAPGTTYTATLAAGAKDRAGNALAQGRSWSFTTAEAPADVTITPNLLDLSPTDVLGCARSGLLTLTNNGPDATFADVSITGPDAGSFTSGSQRFLANNGPFTVQAGTFIQDEVTFRAGPTAADRQRDYRATLTYKDGTGSTIGNPVALFAGARCLNFG